MHMYVNVDINTLGPILHALFVYRFEELDKLSEISDVILYRLCTGEKESILF
jgi:hypothetical protein